MNNELTHWASQKGSERKGHKYIKRVMGPSGWVYYYATEDVHNQIAKDYRRAEKLSDKSTSSLAKADSYTSKSEHEKALQKNENKIVSVLTNHWSDEEKKKLSDAHGIKSSEYAKTASDLRKSAHEYETQSKNIIASYGHYTVKAQVSEAAQKIRDSGKQFVDRLLGRSTGPVGNASTSNKPGYYEHNQSWKNNRPLSREKKITGHSGGVYKRGKYNPNGKQNIPSRY